jgi:hypothetical protein
MIKAVGTIQRTKVALMVFLFFFSCELAGNAKINLATQVDMQESNY